MSKVTENKIQELYYNSLEDISTDNLLNNPLCKERIDKIVNILSNSQEIERLIKKFLSSGEIELPSIFSSEYMVLEKTIYTPHRNFLVFEDQGYHIALVQHHKFARAIYFLDFSLLINLDSHSIGVSSIDDFLSEYLRSNEVIENESTQLNKKPTLFVGYDRPYHYFYDVLPQLIRYRKSVDKDTLYLTIKTYNFFDISLIEEFQKGTIEFNDFYAINDYINKNNLMMVVPGYAERSINELLQFDGIITDSTETYINKIKKEKISKNLKKTDVCIWIGICAEKRSWAEQVQGIRSVIKRINAYYSNVHYVFDGITACVNSSSGDNQAQLMSEKEIVQNICEDLVSAEQRTELMGDYSWSKIYYANKCDFYLSSFLTDSMYPARFAKLPGLAHGANCAMSSDHAHPRTIFIPNTFVTDLNATSNTNWSKVSYSISPTFVSDLFLKLVNGLYYNQPVIFLGPTKADNFFDISNSGESFCLKYNIRNFQYLSINDNLRSFEEIGNSSIWVKSAKKYLINFTCESFIGKGASLHALLCKEGKRVNSIVVNLGTSSFLEVVDEYCYINLYIRVKGEGEVNVAKIDIVCLNDQEDCNLIPNANLNNIAITAEKKILKIGFVDTVFTKIMYHLKKILR